MKAGKLSQLSDCYSRVTGQVSHMSGIGFGSLSQRPSSLWIHRWKSVMNFRLLEEAIRHRVLRALKRPPHFQ